MRMPTSTSRQMMVSVETTASGTTVLASISTAPTRPTRGSWLLLLPSRREEADVRSRKSRRFVLDEGLELLCLHHLLLLRQKAG